MLSGKHVRWAAKVTHLLSEGLVWVVLAGIAILWIAVAQATARIERAIHGLKIEMSLIELHLRDAPWIEAKARRDADYRG